MNISQKAQRSEFSPMRKFAVLNDKAEKEGVKVYHLNIGQPDIDTPSEYFEAIKKFSHNNDYYAPSRGIPTLLESIRKYYGSIRQKINTDDILVTTGGSEAIRMAAFAILNENDEVLIPEPFYPNYSTIINAVGGKVVPIPTNPEDDYRYAEKDKIEKLITKKTKAILITNPNNPTGTVCSDTDAKMLLELCNRYGLYLISDEVYREICFSDEKKSSSMLSFKGYEDNVIIIDSLSKRFSACGARIGALITKNKSIISQAMKLAQARLSVSTLNQTGGAALFDNISKSYSDGLRKEYEKRRNAAVEALKKIKGVKVSVPKGAFYIMATLPVDDSDRFQEWLLQNFRDKNETVMFAPGKCFYATPGKGINEIRIACVLKEKDLSRAIEILGRGIEAYNKK